MDIDNRQIKLLSKDILDALGNAAIIFDENCNTYAFNKQLINLTGLENLEYGYPLEKFLGLIDNEEVNNIIDNYIENEQERHLHVKLFKNEWFNVRICRISNIGFLLEFGNVNTDKKIEQALENSLKKYKSNYNNAPVMMHSTDLNENIVLVSDYWCEKLGYNRNEVIGRSITDFMNHDSKRRWRQLGDLNGRTKPVKDFELILIKKNKEEIDILISTQIEFDVIGKVDRVISGMTEITNLKKAEAKIKQLTNRLLLATQLGNIGVWEFDRESDSIFWEEQMHKIFPSTDTPIIGFSSVEKMFFEEDQAILYNILNKIKQGESYMEEEFRIIYQGELRYIRSFTRVIRDENHKMKSLIGVVYDVTSDKKLQQELESSLEEKNILIREVHHRVKNNMQVISSLLSLKSLELKESSSQNVFENIYKRIKSMAAIHDKLYTFYNVSEVNVSEYLSNIKDEMQIIFDRMDIDVNVSSDNVKINIDRALLLGLVASEIISNAFMHSFPNQKAGKIDIFFKSGESSTMEIINNGKEIPKDILSEGKGIGMTLVRTFVSQLHGEISIHEQNGFRISF